MREHRSELAVAEWWLVRAITSQIAMLDSLIKEPRATLWWPARGIITHGRALKRNTIQVRSGISEADALPPCQGQR